jgi:hypothetical protein
MTQQKEEEAKKNRIKKTDTQKKRVCFYSV